MKIDITESHLEANMLALVRAAPVTAMRHGLLGWTAALLEGSGAPYRAKDIYRSAAPLVEALGVATVYEVPAALTALAGRPPKVVMTALRHPDVVDALFSGLDQLALPGLADRVAQWGPLDRGATAVVPMTEDRLAERAALIAQLRVRAEEILRVWRSDQVKIQPGIPRPDGRSVSTAARVWQLPMIKGDMGSVPTAAAALYPNRLGRSAAVVAYTQITGAIMSMVDNETLERPLALLVAVGEAISLPVSSMTEVRSAMNAAKFGNLPVRVRCGEPVTDEALGLASWWSVFSAWGSSARRSAVAIPTAWRLTEAQGDVLVWVLCSVAVQLGVAAGLARPQARSSGVRPLSWEEHRSAELPRWESGAQSVWWLMQSGRAPERRTAWPGVVWPEWGDVGSWPWPIDADEAGRLESVPSAEGSA